MPSARRNTRGYICPRFVRLLLSLGSMASEVDYALPLGAATIGVVTPAPATSTKSTSTKGRKATRRDDSSSTTSSQTLARDPAVYDVPDTRVYYGILNGKAIGLRMGASVYDFGIYANSDFREVPIDSASEHVLMLSTDLPEPIYRSLLEDQPLPARHPLNIYSVGPFKISRDFIVFVIVAHSPARAEELYKTQLQDFGYGDEEHMLHAKVVGHKASGGKPFSVILVDQEELERQDEDGGAAQGRRKRHRAEAKSSVKYYGDSDWSAADDVGKNNGYPHGNDRIIYDEDDLSTDTKRARY